MIRKQTKLGLQKLWKHCYDALHILCDHNDTDGDGNPDNCLYGYLTVTTESTYIYDENYQLTKCIEAGEYKGTTTYEYWYDEDGNRTKYVKAYEGQTLECYTYTYNTSNQLVSRTNERLWTDNVTNYTYDADGNMTSEKTGCIEKSYEYCLYLIKNGYDVQPLSRGSYKETTYTMTWKEIRPPALMQRKE